MGGEGIRVDGARQLRASLKAAGESLQDLKGAHRQAADIAARASAALAPELSGKLRATIRGAGTNTAGIIRAGKKSVPYAPAVHWGRRFWPNKSHPRSTRSVVLGQPFLSDGAQDSEGKWLPVYEAVLDNAIDKVKGA